MTTKVNLFALPVDKSPRKCFVNRVVYTTVLRYNELMFERCLFFNSNGLVRKINRIWDVAYQQAGLSAPHAYMLRMVAAEPYLSQKEIAEQLQLEKSTITRFTAALTEKGLITRTRTEDERQNSLVVTAKGKKLANKLNRIGDGLYKKMQRQLGSKHFNEFVQQLKQVSQALD